MKFDNDFELEKNKFLEKIVCLNYGFYPTGNPCYSLMTLQG